MVRCGLKGLVVGISLFTSLTAVGFVGLLGESMDETFNVGRVLFSTALVIVGLVGLFATYVACVAREDVAGSTKGGG